MPLLAMLAALTLAATAVLYPAQHEGSGSQPTGGAAIFASTPFVPRSALVNYEVGLSCCPSRTIGNVNVFLFERAGVTCAKLEAARSKRFFSYTVEADGKRLPVGRRVPHTFFQQASFNIIGLTTGFQPGVHIVFTRIDTSPKAVWHGTISVPRNGYKGKTYAFAGSFAARWCGLKTG